MGQKVNPVGLRIAAGFRDSQSISCVGSHYPEWILKSYKIRRFIEERYSFKNLRKFKNDKSKAIDGQIGRIFCYDLSPDGIKIVIESAKPKVIVGDSGAEVEKLKNDIETKFGVSPVTITVNQIHRPMLYASLLGQAIAKQIERGGSCKSAMINSADEAMRQGAHGIKIECNGRIAGAEIARAEKHKVGSVPAHTLRADLDFAITVATTRYGVIGVKVWVYCGLLVS